MDKFKELQEIFNKHANPDNAYHMKKYMKDKFEFYGVKTPERKRLFRDFLKSEKKKNSIDWELLDKCYNDEHREFQYLAIDYLDRFKTKLTYEDVPHILQYIKSKQWWDTIDRFDVLIGNIGQRDDRIDELMLKWSTDDDIWLRRLAIDHQLLRKEKTNTKLLEQILLNNLESDEFFINKAIGWSLRDYSKTNPDWVKNFIDKHREKMSKLSIREGSKYI